VSQQTVAAIGATADEAKRATDAVRSEVPFLAGGADLIIAGTPEECIERVRKTVAMGATTLVLSFGRNPAIASLELFAERVLPAFR
jgi:alkanesulfonate monooxygenase SsuD/methylene tetrahydromethanopterin reductase-like flavin-dependent oxidoreductase (luciferase family)